MDWNLIWSIYDALCKVVGQNSVDSMITVIFMVACCSVIMIMLSITFMFANLSDLMRIPLKNKETTKEHVSLWESLKKIWPKKNKELVNIVK